MLDCRGNLRVYTYSRVLAQHDFCMGWLEKIWYSSVGCPRNNQIFFRLESKWTEAQSVSVVSRNQTNIFLVCFSVLDRYRNNRNKPKKSPKNKSLFGCPRNNYFFSVQTETNRNSTCFGCFSVCFFAKPKRIFFVCFGVSDQYRNNRNKQNLWYGEIKRFIF
jgi:hypothetical protein